MYACRRETHGEQAPDEGAHAAAADPVDLQPGLGEHVEHADVGEAAGPTAGEDHAQ